MNRPGNQSIGNQEHFVYELHGFVVRACEELDGDAQSALHVVRYEDMANEPQRAFAGIAGFLGLRVVPERLEQAIERSRLPSSGSRNCAKAFASAAGNRTVSS